MDPILIGKALDLVIVGLDFLASRNIRITELAAEIDAAHREGRPANVKKFRDEADAAQAAAHAHMAANDSVPPKV